MKNPIRAQNLAFAASAVIVAGVLLYTFQRNSKQPIPQKKKKIEEDEKEVLPKEKVESNVPSESSKPDLEEVTKLVEDADKRGKKLFKSKEYLEAAACFSEALDFASSLPSSHSHRQKITLINNRSAMYEKVGMSELCLNDCDTILTMDANHLKARLRKLRVLETEERYREVLVEVCALQLLFMREHRDKIRMGLPTPAPPVSQEKMEQAMMHVLPLDIETQFAILTKREQQALPSQYTIHQLLESFSGYNAWMARAAKGGSIETLNNSIEGADGIEKVILMFKRGLRYAYDGVFEKSAEDIDAAYALVMADGHQGDLKEDYVRLLEWVGMYRHLRYNLKDAQTCYEECSDLDPTNAELFVKRAGVSMDGGDTDKALSLFQTALDLDPTAADALLHRANLHVLRNNMDEAKSDLEECLKFRPNYLAARLRLATIYMSTNDLDNAEKNLDLAEILDSESSELHSYRGEMFFARGDIDGAKT